MHIVFLLIALTFFYPPIAQADDINAQRALFMQARQSLDSLQPEAFASLRAELADYPLTPYLDIAQAWRQLEGADASNAPSDIDKRIAALLQTCADIPESKDLSKAWVGNLAGRGLWPQVDKQLGTHPELRSAMPDIAMMNDWQAGRQDAALLAYSRIWPQQKGPSEIIAPLHQAWSAAGHPSIEERWERIIRLAGKGQWQEIAALSKDMGKQQKQWLKYWQKLQAEPQTQFEHWPASLSHPAHMSDDLPRAIISDGMHRLIRIDPLRARTTLLQLKHMNIAGIAQDLYASFDKQIALRAAKQHSATASKWLANLPPTHSDEETRAWQTRLFLLAGDWTKVLQSIEAMPPEEQQQSGWQYWKARALDASGKHLQAVPIYSGLASDRGYYSFLAAEQAGLPYRFDNENIEISPAVLQKLKGRPGIQRAREWLALNLISKAEREWYAALAGADDQTWKAAAALAASWNWPDQSIRAAYRGGALNALSERFPLLFEGEVLLASVETGLPSSTIWSIIRQESVFNLQARSQAGASGLMQLMPRTAKMVARQIGLHDAHRELFSPLVNIRLGSRYLADMKSRFNDNLALAAAAYNAGPYRVGQWLKVTPFDTPDIWVEAIPYNETRRYVQHVMAFTIVYQWRKNQQPVSLNEQLGMRPKSAAHSEEEIDNAANYPELSRAPEEARP